MGEEAKKVTRQKLALNTPGGRRKKRGACIPIVEKKRDRVKSPKRGGEA